MLKIALKEFEKNDPEKGNYYYLRSELIESGFSGWTDFVLAESDLIMFVEKLKLLSKDLQGVPALKAGCGDEIYFMLSLEKWKNTGVLWASGELAYPVNSKDINNPQCSHRVKFGFHCELGQLDTFMMQLEKLMAQERIDCILESGA